MICLSISSLYPIDLTAAAYALLMEPQDCLLFVNDSARLPLTSESRVHSARAALPLPQWDWDIDATWYQRHVPLETLDAKGFVEVLRTTAGEIGDILTKGGNKIAAKRCLQHAEKLVDGASAHIDADQVMWWGFIGVLAGALISDITGIRPRTGKWSKVRNGEPGSYPGSEPGSYPAYAMLRRILKPLTVGQYVRFKRGGFVELNIGHTGPNRWVKYESARCVDHGRYRLFGADGLGHIDVDLNAQPFGEVAVQCGGPLELELLADFGTLVHLPWYASGLMSTAPQTLDRWSGWEYVTPITCHDLRRVATRCGGTGQRLTPGGYTLLDYREPEVLSYCSGLIRSGALDWKDLLSWADVASAYPRADERLSKSQVSARSLVDDREKAMGMLDPEEILRCWISGVAAGTEFSKLGEMLLNAIAVIDLIRDWFNPRSQRSLSSESSAFLASVGWVVDGYLDLRNLILGVTFIYEATQTALISHGLPVSQLSAINRPKFEDGLAEVNKRSWPLAVPQSVTATGWERNNGLGLLIQSLRSLSVMYYGLVGFLIGGPLKANLYLLYLLMGPDGTRRAISRVLEKRVHQRIGFALDVVEYGEEL